MDLPAHRDGAAAPRAAVRRRAARATILALLIGLAISSGASASTRTVALTAVPGVAEAAYGPSPQQVAAVYPSASPGSPLVVLVHGGGWRKQGPLGRLELEARSLQSQAFTVVEINYDLASPAFPLESNDVVAAARWAIANAQAYNGDPANVTLLGGSAGGQLVAVAAEQLDAAQPGAVGSVVMLSGPTDFVSLVPLLGPDTLNNEAFSKSVHLALGMGPAGSTPLPVAYAEAWSPALHVPRTSCPRWLIFNSEAEFIPFSQASEMYRNLTAAGCRATLTPVPGSEHSFMYFHRVKAQIAGFIRGR